MDVIELNGANFEEEVMRAKEKVLIDFWASWCMPCRMLSPVVDEIARENPQYLVGKVNVENEPELAQAFNVFSIPTLVVLKDGKLVRQSAGAKSKAQILDMLKD